jgi:hypothetical protein
LLLSGQKRHTGSHNQDCGRYHENISFHLVTLRI